MTEKEKIENQETEENKESESQAESKDLYPKHSELLKAIGQETEEEEPESKTAEKSAEKNKEDQQYTEDERSAMEYGWQPKDKFTGIEENWRSAKDYLERGEMIGRIMNQTKQIDGIKKINRELVDLVRKQSSKVQEKEAQDLLLKKREAIQDGDVEQAEGYEKKYNEIKSELEELQPSKSEVQQAPELAQETMEFIERNKVWFNQDNKENAGMHMYAIKAEEEIYKQHPSWSVGQILNEVEKSVKENFPQMFENRNRSRASSVESPRGRINKKREIKYEDLSGEAQDIVKTMCHGTKMSRDEYARILLDTGAIRYE